MKEEFTLRMHANMLGWSKEDTVLLEVYSLILGGMKKISACRLHNVEVKYYDDNIGDAIKRCHL